MHKWHLDVCYHGRVISDNEMLTYLRLDLLTEYCLKIVLHASSEFIREYSKM